jgi:hypothetical protein
MTIFTGKTIRFVAALALSLMVFACDKGSEKDIPSFISIDNISLKADDGQGTSSSKITDAWIYLDNEFIGTFELPFDSVPVLLEGKHQLKIYCGIKMNGIAATRVPYTFFTPITKEINLVPDSILHLGNFTVKYATNTVFAWQEDFEQNYISIDTTVRSLYKIRRTTVPDSVYKPAGEVSNGSGIAILPSDIGILECVSHESYILPENGTDIFLELNYKTNNAVTVGLFVNTSSKTIQEPLLVLNRTDDWKKIYINLTAVVVNHQDAISYRVFFGVIKDADVSEARFLVDNIKLVHF